VTDFWIPALCHSILRREERALATKQETLIPAEDQSIGLFRQRSGLSKRGSASAVTTPRRPSRAHASEAASTAAQSMLSVPVMFAACKSDTDGLGDEAKARWSSEAAAETVMAGRVMACSAHSKRMDLIKLGEFLGRVLESKAAGAVAGPAAIDSRSRFGPRNRSLSAARPLR
jgi:hypothetical protein